MTPLDAYDPFERQVMEATEKAQRRHAMRPVLVGLVVLIVLGVVSAIFSVTGARATTAASQAAVDRNAELTRQLTALTQRYGADQQASNQSAVTFRNDSRKLLLAICDQIEAVARQAHLTVPPCPRVPLPTPAPAPSPRR